MDRVTAAVTTTFEIAGLLLITLAVTLAVDTRYGLTGAVLAAGTVLLLFSGLLARRAATATEEPTG